MLNYWASANDLLCILTDCWEVDLVNWRASFIARVLFLLRLLLLIYLYACIYPILLLLFQSLFLSSTDQVDSLCRWCVLLHLENTKSLENRTASYSRQSRVIRSTEAIGVIECLNICLVRLNSRSECGVIARDADAQDARQRRNAQKSGGTARVTLSRPLFQDVSPMGRKKVTALVNDVLDCWCKSYFHSNRHSKRNISIVSLFRMTQNSFHGLAVSQRSAPLLQLMRIFPLFAKRSTFSLSCWVKYLSHCNCSRT